MTKATHQAVPRRRAWLLAPVTAAVLFGVGGFAYGAGVIGSYSSGTSAPAAAESSASASDQAPISDSGIELGAGDDEAPENIPSRVSVGEDERVVLTGSGFATEEGEAAVYGFDAPLELDQERLAEVASIFGISGTFEEVDGTWQAGEAGADSLGPQLVISIDGVASLWYSDPSADQGQAPTVEVATGMLRDLIAELGWDPDRFEFDSTELDDSATVREVSATLLLDGMRSDVTISASVTSTGFFAVWGQLAQPLDLGRYPTVSQTEAFDRLDDARYGVVAIYPHGEGGEFTSEAGTGDEWTPATQPQPMVDGDSKIPWPVTTRELVSVQDGSMQVTQSDGSVLIVPSYVFSTADGTTYEVVALAEEVLTFNGG